MMKTMNSSERLQLGRRDQVGVIWRDYGALVTGSSMEPGSARQDFELEHMSVDFAVEVERRTNAELAADREVRVRMRWHARGADW